MITTLVAGLPLADNDFGDTQSDGVTGPVGLLIIVLLAIGTIFLIRSMSRHIKRLPQSFDQASNDAKTVDESVPERSASESGKD
jgi:hypothetical protein